MEPRLSAASPHTIHLPLDEEIPVFVHVDQQEDQKGWLKIEITWHRGDSPGKREKGILIDGIGDSAGAVPERGVDTFPRVKMPVKKRRIGDKRRRAAEPAEPVEQERPIV